jgi:hypothetical protein
MAKPGSQGTRAISVRTRPNSVKPFLLKRLGGSEPSSPNPRNLGISPAGPRLYAVLIVSGAA